MGSTGSFVLWKSYHLVNFFFVNTDDLPAGYFR
jgi:hypothetical protein